jgi:hypothetical protein
VILENIDTLIEESFKNSFKKYLPHAAMIAGGAALGHHLYPNFQLSNDIKSLTQDELDNALTKAYDPEFAKSHPLVSQGIRLHDAKDDRNIINAAKNKYEFIDDDIVNMANKQYNNEKVKMDEVMAPHRRTGAIGGGATGTLVAAGAHGARALIRKMRNKKNDT